eukprot:2467710-Pleurochrysis_carterae.AAC.2
MAKPARTVKLLYHVWGSRKQRLQNSQGRRVIPRDGSGRALNKTAALPFVLRTMETKFGVQLASGFGHFLIIIEV